MKFEALTDLQTMLGVLPERVEEYNRMHRDSREHLSLLSCDAAGLVLRVSCGRDEAAATDFVATVSEQADGTTLISGDLQKASSGKRRLFAILYGLALSGFARLTLLLLLYGAVLGISLLVGGDSFLLPLVPSLAIALWMSLSALRVAVSKRRRTASFFTSYLACRQLSES